MNEKKALAQKCQTHLTMMKHSNPFVHANGRGDSGLNTCLGKDAQCGKDRLCYRRREKTGRSIVAKRYVIPSQSQMGMLLSHGSLFSHSSLASAPHAARLHRENER